MGADYMYVNAIVYHFFRDLITTYAANEMEPYQGMDLLL